MARKTATKDDALATTHDDAAALAELGDFFDNVEVDGMDDVENDDLKIASKVWNMKGLDKNGKAYPKDVFYDTVDEAVQDEVGAVLLLTRKSNRYDTWNQAEEKTEVCCQSDDRVTGVTDKHPTVDAGTVRNCNGCPDAGWYRDAEGKPKRKCGPVHTVVAIERTTQRPFVMRFKKTGLKPFRSHVQKHHHGKRIVAGKASNIPLFAYEAKLSLKMHEGGNYAMPVLERGDLLPREEMQAMHESAKQFKEIAGEVMDHADATDAKHDTAGRDDNMSSDDFADG